MADTTEIQATEADLQDEASLAVVETTERQDIQGLMPDAEIADHWSELLPELRSAGRPWSRLPEETERAYLAFLIYLRLGPMQRSKALCGQVYRQAIKDMVEVAEDSRRVPRRIHIWASRYDWDERVRLWDNHFHAWVVEQEKDKRRQESALMAIRRRSLRARWLLILEKIFARAEAKLADEALSAKDLRDTVLALDRAGLIQEKVFEGITDVLSEADDDAPLPADLAGGILAFVRQRAEGLPSPRTHGEAPVVIHED